MASVLCRGVCDCVRDVCNGIGTILCLPCRLCGAVTTQLGDIVCSPFSLFLSAALGLNLPPIVFFFKALTNLQIEDADGCRAMDWLKGDAILCAVNMVAAVHIVYKIMDDKIHQRENGFYESMTGNSTKSNSCARIKHVLCDDPVVAIYLLFFIVYLIWTPLGIARSQDDACDPALTHYAGMAVLCNFLFLFFGSFAFCLSICCLR